MELHSYAKRRTSKKWTIEQKRKLVEARIAHDSWFTNKPSSVVLWKNILVVANLDDFNVFFVRKQWSNMLTRYKQYKQTRLGNISTIVIDAETIRRINQEWEFFGPIHAFMTRKTTNLHSYALTHRSDNTNEENEQQQHQQNENVVQTSSTAAGLLNTTTTKSPTKLQNETVIITTSQQQQQDCIKENIPNNNTTIVIQQQSTFDSNAGAMSNDDGIHLFSSDTNDDFQMVSNETTRLIHKAQGSGGDNEKRICVRNTDHDFYSKRSKMAAAGGESIENVANNRLYEEELHEQQVNYFADASEESQGSTSMLVDLHPYASSSLTPINVETVSDQHGQSFEIKCEQISQLETIGLKEEDEDLPDEMPSTSTQRNISQLSEHNNIPTSSTARLNERDKYYRHKRRFNRRLEKRFDAILQVMGQIVKAEYPSIDITPLVATATSVASTMGQIFTSDSEDDDNHSEVAAATADNIPTN